MRSHANASSSAPVKQKPVHLRDDHLGHRRQQLSEPPGREIEKVADLAAVEPAFAERFQIDSGAERATGPGEHDDGGGIVGADVVGRPR